MVYAGFWRRFGAMIVDGIVLNVAFLIIGFVLGLLGFSFFESVELSTETGDMTAGVSGGYELSPAGSVITIVVTWLYYALMESSARGATLGKMALGLRVTDLDGNRIGFGRATARHFGKFISAMILMIGFIMAGFTKRKQALHDIMAGCLVVAKAA